MPKQIPPLPVPRNRPRLEPFYTVFVEVVVPFARGAQLFSATRRLSRRQRKRLLDDIESAFEHRAGVRLDPALYVRAFQVCLYFFHRAGARLGVPDAEVHLQAVDEVYCLLKHLEIDLGLRDIFIRV